MSKTLVDIDDELLRSVRQILGVSTKKDAVNGALRELVRRDAAARFLEMAGAGIFDTTNNGRREP